MVQSLDQHSWPLKVLGKTSIYKRMVDSLRHGQDSMNGATKENTLHFWLYVIQRIFISSVIGTKVINLLLVAHLPKINHILVIDIHFYSLSDSKQCSAYRPGNTAKFQMSSGLETSPTCTNIYFLWS